MTAFTDQQFSEWQKAIGRTRTREQLLDSESARRYAVATGLDPDSVSSLVHWAWFLDATADTEIGLDGHPQRGKFLPDISLPRRMFAASSIHFDRPLEIGQLARINVEIKDIFRKTGKQGELVFAQVERLITQSEIPCIRETQTLVYRGEGGSIELPREKSLPKDPADELWRPNTVNLFRFSAVTFNSHRIHYDYRYASREEGYPELVVHGPFTATKLADFAARYGTLASFEFRGLAPLFQGQEILLRAASKNVVQAVRCDGAVAVEAKVVYR